MIKLFFAITSLFLNEILWHDHRSNRLKETIRTNGHTIGFRWETKKLKFWISTLSVPLHLKCHKHQNLRAWLIISTLSPPFKTTSKLHLKTIWIWMRHWVTWHMIQNQAAWHSFNICTNFIFHQVYWSTLKIAAEDKFSSWQFNLGGLGVNLCQICPK